MSTILCHLNYVMSGYLNIFSECFFVLICHTHEIEVDEFGGNFIIDSEYVGITALKVHLLEALEDDKWVHFESNVLILV